MKTIIFLLPLIFGFIQPLFAQKNKSTTVPLVADKWTFQPNQVEFTKENGVSLMKIMPEPEKSWLKTWILPTEQLSSM